jgi:hypothetical protein
MRQPCAFPDCQTPAAAKGLCAKHAMRLRRHGDPAKVNRRGRKDKDRPGREMLSELSDRTYARYKRGLRLLDFVGLDAGPVIARCTRPNGSVNFAAIERIAEAMTARRIVELYPET